MKTAILFPGQGSQRPGMGAGLFDRYPDMLATANDILDFPIQDFCLNSSKAQMNNTRYVQPALFTVNAMHYRALCEDENPVICDYLVGHSLGEYNALLAAGVFDFATGLQLVKKRGELTDGNLSKVLGMAAVLGLNRAEVKQIIAENLLTDLHVANDNASNQVVVSGPSDVLAHAEEVFYDNYAVNYLILQVNNAFHSLFMKEAAQYFSEYLTSFQFNLPGKPVISNVSGQPHDKANIAGMMTAHLTSPVLWCDSIKYLRANGVTDFREVGHSTTLTDLNKYI